MDSEYEKGVRAGLIFGCAVQGTTYSNFKKAAHCLRECEKNKSVQKMLAKIASYICKNAGEEFNKTAAIYDAIDKHGGVETAYAYNMYIEPALKTLSKVPDFTKQAGILSSIVGGLKGAVTKTPDLIYKLALLGAIGGAGVGTLGWSLSRDISDDDATAKAKHEQAKLYKRIAQDLQKRIDAQQDMSASNKKVRKIAEEEDSADYVL